MAFRMEAMASRMEAFSSILVRDVDFSQFGQWSEGQILCIQRIRSAPDCHKALALQSATKGVEILEFQLQVSMPSPRTELLAAFSACV